MWLLLPLVVQCAHVGIVAVMTSPPDITKWLAYHRYIGVNKFYLRMEGAVPRVLETAPDVTLWKAGAPNVDGATEEYASLQDRQHNTVMRALDAAKTDGVQWLAHIDDDELLYGFKDNRRGLPKFLEGIPAKYASVKLKNVEGVYESSNITDCFVQANKFRGRMHSGPMVNSYNNGKSIVRVGDSRVAITGPHDMSSAPLDLHWDGSRAPWQVLHFESCPFHRWETKFWNLRSSLPLKHLIPFEFYRVSIKRMRDCMGQWGTAPPWLTNGTVGTPALRGAVGLGVDKCSTTGLRKLYEKFKCDVNNTELDIFEVDIDWKAIQSESLLRDRLHIS